jgi:hypothetical protein
MLAFYETLVRTLPPKSQSDRTCFRRLTNWLQDGIEAGRLEEDVLREVLTYAQEARGPGIRNPRAVFITICKKELGYDSTQARP